MLHTTRKSVHRAASGSCQGPTCAACRRKSDRADMASMEAADACSTCAAVLAVPSALRCGCSTQGSEPFVATPLATACWCQLQLQRLQAGARLRHASVPALAPAWRSQARPPGASQFQLGDSLQVDDVGPVGQAQGACPRKHVRQRRDVAHPRGAVHLRRAAGRGAAGGRMLGRGPSREAAARQLRIGSASDNATVPKAGRHMPSLNSLPWLQPELVHPAASLEGLAPPSARAARMPAPALWPAAPCRRGARMPPWADLDRRAPGWPCLGLPAQQRGRAPWRRQSRRAPPCCPRGQGRAPPAAPQACGAGGPGRDGGGVGLGGFWHAPHAPNAAEGRACRPARRRSWRARRGLATVGKPAGRQLSRVAVARCFGPRGEVQARVPSLPTVRRPAPSCCARCPAAQTGGGTAAGGRPRATGSAARRGRAGDGASCLQTLPLRRHCQPTAQTRPPRAMPRAQPSCRAPIMQGGTEAVRSGAVRARHAGTSARLAAPAPAAPEHARPCR